MSSLSRLNKAQKEIVKGFASVTETTEKAAFEVLKAAEWDQEVAFELHYAQLGARGGSASLHRVKPSDAGVEASYRKYKDESEDMIRADGVMRLCEDLSVDPSDVSLLVLAYHCKAAEMCAFSRAEWGAGMAVLGCDTVAKLAAKLPGLRASLGRTADDATFRAVYAYAFAFAREKGAKTLAPDTALALWQLLLPGRWALAQQWLDFLPTQGSLKSVTADVWSQLLEFARAVKPDLSNYDANGAWPSLIDDFVEVLQAAAPQA